VDGQVVGICKVTVNYLKILVLCSTGDSANTRNHHSVLLVDWCVTAAATILFYKM
jgi:hypothetical protein